MNATEPLRTEGARERWLPLLLLLGAMAGPGLGLLAASLSAHHEPMPRWEYANGAGVVPGR